MDTLRLRMGKAALAIACVLAAATAEAAPTCYHNYGAIDAMKPNKLFLYFPTTDDPTFPAYAALTSPARTFDLSLLPNPPAVGSTSQLRDRVFDVVATDYCEFNVQVQPPTTTNPDALVMPPTRRNMVAIGADANGTAAGVLFGQAQNVDTGDGLPVDHARVWGGSYGVFCGAPGGDLDGAGNTLERWALGLGSTAAHEAGHNYGLSHGAGAVLHAGEDLLTNHIMPAGSLVPCADRVGHLRHFSDNDFGILANNVGLTLQSLANWDFVNPNAGTASALRMEVLSLSGTLTPVSTYLGSLSPWNVPAVTGPMGTSVFKGTVYNRFFVTWQTAKGWTSPNLPGSIAGQVRGGEQFHIGTHFAEEDIVNTSDHVVIVDTVLLDGGGTVLALHPRTPTYGTGMLAADGTFTLDIANLVAVNLVLRNWRAWVLPRPLHIDAMMFDAKGQIDFRDVQKEPVRPWRQIELPSAAELPAGSADKPGEARFVLGNLFKDGRNVRIKLRGGNNDGSVGVGEVNPDVARTLATDPFPGASVFLEGELVEPGALQWDPEQKQYVSKDLVTRVFLQVAGKRAKPVDGVVSGLLRSNLECVNLNSRKSVAVQADKSGGFDCEKGGLISMHGDRMQVTQTGLVGTTLPTVQVSGLDLGGVVCTNLSTGKSVSLKPRSNTEALDCRKAGLEFGLEHTLQVTVGGTVR